MKNVTENQEQSYAIQVVGADILKAVESQIPYIEGFYFDKTFFDKYDLVNKNFDKQTHLIQKILGKIDLSDLEKIDVNTTLFISFCSSECSKKEEELYLIPAALNVDEYRQLGEIL